jgi:hypothetical protein
VNGVFDPEGSSSFLYELAGADPSEPPGPVALARAVLGSDGIELVPSRIVMRDAALARVGDRWRIYVRRSLPAERLTFGVAHELAEWLYRSSQDDLLEEACNALAGALIVPAPAFRRVLAWSSDFGEAFRQAAEAYRTTPSCAVLRLGEATGRPVALVTPRYVRVRGEAFEWPPEDVIRAMARRPGPGLAKVPTGERGRVALVAG